MYAEGKHTHADMAIDTPNSVNQRCIACLGNQPDQMVEVEIIE